MDEGTNDSERSTEFDVGALIARVKADSSPNSPEGRAKRVLEHLVKGAFTDWDVLCFTVEYIGSRVSFLPWLMPAARDLTRALYLAHYVRFENVEWMDKQSLVPGQTRRHRKDNWI